MVSIQERAEKVKRAPQGNPFSENNAIINDLLSRYLKGGDTPPVVIPPRAARGTGASLDAPVRRGGWLYRLYGVLAKRANRLGWVNNVSLDEIARELGVTRTQVTHYLRRIGRMRRKPILVVKRRGSHRCNSYKIRFVSDFLPSCNSPQTPLYTKERYKDSINAKRASVGGVKKVKEELLRGDESWWRRRAMKVTRRWFTLEDGVGWHDFWRRKGVEIIKLIGYLVWKVKIPLARVNALLSNGCVYLAAILTKAAQIIKRCRVRDPRALLVALMLGR